MTNNNNLRASNDEINHENSDTSSQTETPESWEKKLERIDNENIVDTLRDKISRIVHNISIFFLDFKKPKNVYVHDSRDELQDQTSIMINSQIRRIWEQIEGTDEEKQAHIQKLFGHRAIAVLKQIETENKFGNQLKRRAQKQSQK